MRDRAEASTLLFQTIGSPVGSGTVVPDPEVLEELTEFIFKSRIGLLFLDECRRHGVELGPRASELHESLQRRREATEAVVVTLARTLDEIAEGEWVLFKSIKPFASTPNDTDWFPFDRALHARLVDHLIESGRFIWMERAPLQTTLIEAAGTGVTDTTKRGGVYYIDCYVAPSTDYFVYLDPARLRGSRELHDLRGYRVPVLSPAAELVATMFHNVFPEKTFTVESYFLIKAYLDQLGEQDSYEEFIRICADQHVEYACAANLCLTRAIDHGQFGRSDPVIDRLLDELGHAGLDIAGFDPCGVFPYGFPASVFWRAFCSKQRDLVSFRSTLNQGLHMLNPVFMADVLKVIHRRVRNQVYEQN